MATIAPYPIYTTEMRRMVACLVAGALQVNSKDMNILNPSYSYARQEISALVKYGALAYTNDVPRALRFTPLGVERLRTELPGVYHYYMQNSCEGKYGRSAEHKTLMQRQSHVQSCMLAAEVEIGAQRPILDAGTDFKELAFDPNQPRYYSGKDLRMIRNTSVAREQISRASGILTSSSIVAPVYDVIGSEPLFLNVSAERSMAIGALAAYKMIYPEMTALSMNEHTAIWSANDCNAFGIEKAIVFCDEETMLDRLKALQKQKKRTSKRASIFEIIANPNIWKMHWHYFPRTLEGCEVLKYAVRKRREDWLRILLKIYEKEGLTIDNKMQMYYGGQPAIEFCSADLTRLQRGKDGILLRRKYEKDPVVIVLCWDYQADFVDRFLGDVPHKILSIYKKKKP